MIINLKLYDGIYFTDSYVFWKVSFKQSINVNVVKCKGITSIAKCPKLKSKKLSSRKVT